MISAEVTRRLQWHAGLAEIDDTTLLPVASCTGSRSHPEGRTDAAARDFIATLARLNVELNGPVPSAGIGGATVISRDVVYAVTEVIRLLREDLRQDLPVDRAKNTLQALWLAETAWSAVLAGDIDDLEQHLVDEQVMRSRR